MLTAKELFDLSVPIEESSAGLNKYTKFAFSSGLKNYRLLTNEFIFHNKITPEQLPRHIISFINEHGKVLYIYNFNSGIIRSLATKNFLTFGKAIFYGLYQLDPNFKFGDPIVLVEGALDCDVAKRFYPNVLATVSAGLSKLQKEVLTILTNKVVLMYDNDDAGFSAKRRDYKALMDIKTPSGAQHFQLTYGNYPEALKDWGDLAELAYRGNQFELQNLIPIMKANLDASLHRLTRGSH